MPTSPARVVLDTNVVLRGLLNAHSASGRVLKAVEKRAVIQVLSKPLLAEYRAVLSDPAVVDRFPELTPERVEVALRRAASVTSATTFARCGPGFISRATLATKS